METTKTIALVFALALAGCGGPLRGAGALGGSVGNDGGAGDLALGGDTDGHDAGAPSPPPLALDAGSALPDLTLIACSPACGANQVCNNGSCENLPNACPCPMGAYCDLASNSCKAGCLADGDCNAGLYCDTTTRTCQSGCRGNADCPSMADACVKHVCGNSCNCDDGNACTSDSCVRDKCQHSELGDGTACGDDGNVCTRDVCSAGVCTHPASDGTACASDGNACTSDVCSGGACTHPVAADFTQCGTVSKEPEYCSAGVCKATSTACTCTASGCTFYFPGDAPTSVISCACNGAELDETEEYEDQIHTYGMACNGACQQSGNTYLCWQ